MTMSNTHRRNIERKIAKRVIRDLLAAGHGPVSVYDDRNEPFPVCTSNDPAEIFAAMFSTNEDLLTIGDKLRGRGENEGWVWFIGGNGEDIVSDYTTNLDSVILPIYDWIESGFDDGDPETAPHMAFVASAVEAFTGKKPEGAE